MKPCSLFNALLLCTVPVWAKLTPEQLQGLPAPADHAINFDKEIRPLLENACVKCHGNGKKKGGFLLDTREDLLKGGDSGAAVAPGKSGESYLIELVSGADPDNVMPQKGSRLKPEQISLLRAWIDQDLPWPEGFTFKKEPAAPLEPRKPELPAVAEAQSGNEVDRFLTPYFAKHGIPLPEPVSDRVFARRVYLDVIGLLPAPEELQAFLNDPSADKREKLVDQLLADKKRYAEHWLSFWNDALRNDYKGTGYIDGGRKQITPWLYKSLVENKPFNRFVTELIHPTEASEGFIKGIVWRGVVNASQTPEMQAAQNFSQVFMGVNLKCASCHDSFVNDWELADAYGLASIFAEKPLEMFKCDVPTGKTSMMKFLYPELGGIDPELPRSERLKQLAELVTQEKNGRLARTMVNRMWAKFFGRGLVEPVDEMDNPPWNRNLLDWLAADFAEHNYDLKWTMRKLLTSRAYGLPSVGAPEQIKEFVFQGPLRRRLSAEQYVDALSALTGIWGELPANKEIDFAAAGGPPNPAWKPSAARWIWPRAEAASAAKPGTVYFRKSFYLKGPPTEAVVLGTADNQFTLFVNGHEAVKSSDWKNPKIVSIREHLKAGQNVLAVSAVNDPGNSEGAANPAGLILFGFLRPAADGELMAFGTDSSWLAAEKKSEGWQKVEFEDIGWAPAVEQGTAEAGPWNLAGALESRARVINQLGKTRASLLAADPLSVALGRPNREQTLTSRASVATTLQALELTNGPTLAERLRAGAEKLTAASQSPLELVDHLFTYALGRPPQEEERSLATQLTAADPKAGVEDLLWAMTLLPEFQLIY